ncbi:MAG: MBOAT family protein, partial [Kiritimatiellae bacterium]|nr:MBOAT family protein [Kiritimatiellia bacterium]
MLFTSIEFLFLFLPLTLAVYFVLPLRWGLKNAWLLAASLLFYAWGEPTFVFVMLGSIAFNYVAALVVDAARGRRGAAGAALAAAVAGNLAVIGLWKYANFATATLRAWFPSLRGAVPQTSFLLPIGISFFTFQALSYVVDVARGDVKVQRNPLRLALYIALFPQLIAGPIVRYSTVCGQIESRRTTPDMFGRGVLRFLYGFNKKMLLANLFASVADRAFGMPDPGCGMAWLGAAAYTLQIFFDFSGYSDMAIGLGLVFGFRFLENFDYPYVSKTVTEFWRRWHMSLGSWFRDYVYFPLGGSRVGRARLVANLAVVWTLTGVWHGANWTFILWGALYGVLITAEKLADLPRRVDANPLLRAVYQPFTLLAVVLGWVLFRSADLPAAGAYLKAMFGGGAGSAPGLAAYQLGEIAAVLAAGALLSTPLVRGLRRRLDGSAAAGT